MPSHSTGVAPSLRGPSQHARDGCVQLRGVGPISFENIPKRVDYLKT
jgi:hypothetical protein